MRIAIGSDHAGFDYKEKIRAMLAGLGHEVKDMGAYSDESVDYPLWIRPVAEAVARGEYDRGIILGGSGNGEAIVANKVPGIRCTLCWNVESAEFARQHNDANVLSMGQRLVEEETALEVVRVWLTTGFDGGRHERRIRLGSVQAGCSSIESGTLKVIDKPPPRPFLGIHDTHNFVAKSLRCLCHAASVVTERK